VGEGDGVRLGVRVMVGEAVSVGVKDGMGVSVGVSVGSLVEVDVGEGGMNRVGVGAGEAVFEGAGKLVIAPIGDGVELGAACSIVGVAVLVCRPGARSIAANPAQ
jgi:hypothetical protein